MIQSFPKQTNGRGGFAYLLVLGLRIRSLIKGERKDHKRLTDTSEHGLLSNRKLQY